MKYRSMHTKVARLRGAASMHRCVDCRRTAAEWSFIGDLATALWALTGSRLNQKLKPYSLNVSDYVPRCRRCHRLYDRRETAARRAAA